MPHRFVHPLRVRYGECDPQGIVFNANYMLYADVALTEFTRAVFGSYEALVEQHGIDLVVGEINVRFRAAARFDDELEIAFDRIVLGTTSWTSEISMRRDGQLLIEATTRHVFVDPKTLTKVPVPDTVRSAIAPWTGTP